MTPLPKLSAADRIAIFGTDTPVEMPTCHHVGAYSVTIADGQIGAIHHQGREIVRGLTYLVRDVNWATCPADIRMDLEQPDRIELTGTIDEDDIRFSYSITVLLDDTGTLHVQSRGKALAPFDTNRIGLTILHPMPNTVGRPLMIEHADKSQTRTVFPIAIQPDQPALNISKLRYPLSGSESVMISFNATLPDSSSDSFEMEDQRNWGDASYKTYSGSLLAPWPYAVKQDDCFEQAIRISIEPGVAGEQTPAATRITDRAFRLPALGVNLPLGRAGEALQNLSRYGAPNPAFVSAYLRTDTLDAAEIETVKAVVGHLSCPLRLELEVHGDPAAAIKGAAAKLNDAGLDVSHILACPAPYLKSYQPAGAWPDVEPLDVFYARLREAFPEAEIGGGMLTYFTELNRRWPPLAPIDFIGHAYCPIIHAADNRTILQNIATLPLIAETIAVKAPSVPYDLLSASLSMRSNPYGAAPMVNRRGRQIPMADADPREAGEFAAIWMLEVARALAGTHVRSCCLGALAGPSSLYDDANSDGRRPAFRAFEALANIADADRASFEECVWQLQRTEFHRGHGALAHLLG